MASGSGLSTGASHRKFTSGQVLAFASALDNFFEWHPESYIEDEMARAGLPEEIKNNQYASEKELHMDLEQFGLDDLSIILDQDGFPMWLETAGKEHDGAVGKIIDQFEDWKNGRSIKGRAKVNVFVNDSYN